MHACMQSFANWLSNDADIYTCSQLETLERWVDRARSGPVIYKLANKYGLHAEICAECEANVRTKRPVRPLNDECPGTYVLHELDR